VGREAVPPNFYPAKEGRFLFTGATASLRARPPSLHSLPPKRRCVPWRQGLAREFGPQVIHVAHIVIAAPFQGRIRGHQASPTMFALALHVSRQGMDHELDLRPFKEPF